MNDTDDTHQFSPEDLDAILTAQIAVAWAGEGGEEPRLGWWKSDLLSEFGGRDLFARLLPATHEWAALEATREAARMHDASMRSKTDDPDSVVSLYRFGFALDERLDERLAEHKRAGKPLADALPHLDELLRGAWDRSAFEAWATDLASSAPKVEAAPVGRRLKGQPPLSEAERAAALVAALSPLHTEYPLPHYRVR